MEIIIGKTAGFCYGVKRAVEGAKEEAKKSDKNIYALGEIVHNKEVIKDLSEKGIKFIDNINEAEQSVIIRAHGVEKNIYEEAEKRGIKVIDFTCPNVLRIHEIAEQYKNEDYYIILFGSKEHPENIGTISHCGESFSVINDESEIEEALQNIQKAKKDKVLIISQTTYSMQKFLKYTDILKEELEKNNIEVIIKNTICRATELRQNETEKIAKEVDYMIIIGGKNSSNTKKLFEIANKYCENAICVETKNELNLEDIKDCNKIGIMAGASTPQESVDEVVNSLKNLKCSIVL